MKNYADRGGWADNTLLDLQNSSYHTQPHPIIVNYFFPTFLLSFRKITKLRKVVPNSLIVNAYGRLKEIMSQKCSLVIRVKNHCERSRSDLPEC